MWLFLMDLKAYRWCVGWGAEGEGQQLVARWGLYVVEFCLLQQ